MESAGMSQAVCRSGGGAYAWWMACIDRDCVEDVLDSYGRYCGAANGGRVVSLATFLGFTSCGSEGHGVACGHSADECGSGHVGARAQCDEVECHVVDVDGDGAGGFARQKLVQSIPKLGGGAGSCSAAVSGNACCSVVGDSVVGSRDGDFVAQSNGAVVEEPVVRGKHYERNKKKRARAKLQGGQRKQWTGGWRGSENCRRVDGNGGCVSDSSVAGTSYTVDTRTGVEIEAARTLAARRVVENELAIAQGKARLASFEDKSKTEALARLSVARMEQRINEAKAKSQASYKKCDQSLKSLGSSGSAGEFALKQQVKDAHQDRALLKYVEAQAALFARDASPETLAEVARLPPPVFESEHEVFGECPDDYNEDEQFAYYRDLDRREFEQNEKCLSFSPFQ